MANELVNFNLPSPYQADLAKLAQQQKMAELLQAQSLQPTERYSYKGIEAHTPATAGLAKILQAMGGMYLQKQGLEEQKALGEKYRADEGADISKLGEMFSAPAVPGSAAVPERQAGPAMASATGNAPTQAMDEEGNPIEMPYSAAKPAVASRIQGQIDPSMIAGLKLPEYKKMALAQMLAQAGPEKLMEVNAGQSLYSPRQGKTVFTAPDKKEYGTTPSYEKDDTSPTGYVAVLYGKNGERKVVGPANPMNQFTTGSVDAALQRDMDMYKFGNLSADQRSSLGVKLTQAGVDVARLNYETGQGPARQPALPANAPVPNFGTQTLPPAKAGQPTQPVNQPVTPVAVTPAPRIGMAPARPAQPATQPTSAPSLAGNNTASAQVVAQSLNNRPIPQKLLDQAAVEKIKSTGTNENTLRDEYNTLTKDFRVIQDAHEKIKSVAATGAGDMSLLYSFVKLLDPGSVVRESEFAAAAASGSFGERVQGAMQRVISGQRLPDTLRNDFIREADNLYTSQKRGTDRLTESYTGIAKRMGLNPANIIVDYASKAGTAMPPVSSLVEGKTTNFDNGQSWTLQNGKPVQVK